MLDRRHRNEEVGLTVSIMYVPGLLLLHRSLCQRLAMWSGWRYCAPTPRPVLHRCREIQRIADEGLPHLPVEYPGYPCPEPLLRSVTRHGKIGGVVRPQLIAGASIISTEIGVTDEHVDAGISVTAYRTAATLATCHVVELEVSCAHNSWPVLPSPAEK